MDSQALSVAVDGGGLLLVAAMLLRTDDHREGREAVSKGRPPELTGR